MFFKEERGTTDFKNSELLPQNEHTENLNHSARKTKHNINDTKIKICEISPQQLSNNLQLSQSSNSIKGNNNTVDRPLKINIPRRESSKPSS